MGCMVPNYHVSRLGEYTKFRDTWYHTCCWCCASVIWANWLIGSELDDDTTNKHAE